jgi:NADPH-dependent curcumin reductase CurA
VRRAIATGDDRGMTTSRAVHLARRPELGQAATPDSFELIETELPEPADGQVRVDNLFISVDPYMRNRLNDIKSYVPPFEVGRPLTGGAVGVVTASRAPALPEGTLVLSDYGWREGFVTAAEKLTPVPALPAGVSPSAYLGVLGMTGLTAWVGVTLIAPVTEGDVFYVSAAAGAVGSIAGQLARVRGARKVIGSAGSPDKVEALTKVFGFDAAFSYRDGDVETQLAAVAPKGIDVYFDNVGGDHLAAALRASRPFGRMALCGSISTGYDGGEGAPVAGLGLAVGKQLSLRGFIVSSYADRQPEFIAEVAPLLASGKLVAREHVVPSLDGAVGAFLDLFGSNPALGKVVVDVSRRD